MEYPKINSVFKRDEHKHFIIGQYATPEIEYLAGNQWMWTEKVDGMNCRVIWDGKTVQFGGKTDMAVMPAFPLETLRGMFPAEKLAAQFPPDINNPENLVVLYGECYGSKINKGGKYRDDPSFVLFDVRVGRWWLLQPNVVDIAVKLGIDFVPVMGIGTIPEAVEFVKAGFFSKWNPTNPFQAEGIVLRPVIFMASRAGGRIITKLKFRDFAHLKNV